jgi:tetratricopeptide (TPR) repeat protein
MFRLLGILNGTEIGVPTAAALAGVAPWDAITALDYLVDVRLLRPVARDHYRMNELTTLYAREWLTADSRRAEYHAALGNVLDWYLAGAERASVTLRPTDSRRIGGYRAPRPAVDIPIGDPAQAVEWIDAERANLLAVIGQAAEIEGPLARTAAHLALTLYHPLANRGHSEDRVRLNQIAVRVARQAGDRWREAQATEDLGFIYGTVGRVDEAVEHARRALRLWREVDDPASEMNALSDLGLAYRQQGQYRRAIACLQRGLVIGREIGFNRGEAVAFNHLGLAYQKTGDHERAIDYQQRSIHRYGELDDQRGEAIALANLGWLHQRDGRLRQAADCHEGSLAIFRYFQDRYNEAEQLWGLGEVRLAQGEPSKAREYWDESLSILDVIDSLEPDEAGCLRQPVPGAPKAILLNT